MADSIVFEERVPRSERVDAILFDLSDAAWRPALACLYLCLGRYIPDEAKRRGCSFGFCDEHGTQQPEATATHVGWTVG